MPRFEEEILDSKRKLKKNMLRLQLLLGLFIIGGIIFFKDIFWDHFFLYIIFGLNFLWIGIGKLKERQLLYFEFDDQKIEWLVFENSTQIVCLSWDTIKWIKKENSGGITFFRESSFSEHFSMKWMTVEQQKELFAQIEETANSKQIRLVNF